MRIALSVFCLLATSLLCRPVLAQAGREEIQLFVPAYSYPAGERLKEWEKLIAAARQVPIVAIANPASGPSERTDPNHANIISRAGSPPTGAYSVAQGGAPAEPWVTETAGNLHPNGVRFPGAAYSLQSQT